MNLFNRVAVLVILSGASFAVAGETNSTHLLWSDKPVIFSEIQEKTLRYADKTWSEQVFPLGNGRLGCTVFGDPNRERIQFNEDSLWVGNEDHTGGYQPFGDVYVELGARSSERGARSVELGARSRG